MPKRTQSDVTKHPSEPKSKKTLQEINIYHTLQPALVQVNQAMEILYANSHARHIWCLDSNGAQPPLFRPGNIPGMTQVLQKALRETLSESGPAEKNITGLDDGLLSVHYLKDGSRIIYYLDLPEHLLSPESAKKISTRSAGLRKLRQHWQQEIIKAIIDTQEQERRRIAENLHIEIGQLLTAVQMQLDHLDRNEIKKRISEAIRKVRTVSFELMPSVLKDFGLESALKDMIGKSLLDRGIHCQFSFHVPARHLDDDTSLIIFRIIQELVNNIVKHAGASQVSIQVKAGVPGFRIIVEDNGIGMDPDHMTSGFGLLSIRNRVQALSGKFMLSSRDGQGMQVAVKFPFPSADDPIEERIAD